MHSQADTFPVPKSARVVYSLYGLVIASEFEFTCLEPIDAGAPDVVVTAFVDAHPRDLAKELTLVFASRDLNYSGQSLAYLYRGPNYDLIRLTGIADFHVWQDRIACQIFDAACREGVEQYLLGAVLSFWLERRGTPTLHAAAVSISGRAIGFLASNMGGKTSLATSLMRKGHPLLTDDVLPLTMSRGEVMAMPGYPRLRMWPGQAAHFLGPVDSLSRVLPYLEKLWVPVAESSFGAFCSSPQPLACIYIPERRDRLEDFVCIEVLSPLEAMKELIRHSFVPYFVEAFGLQSTRLAFFAKLVRQVSVRRVHYSNGLDRLPDVAAEIIKDVEAL